MEWGEDAFVLSARAHGETGAVVELLTETHGRFAAHVAGGASRRMKPFLQPGARVMAEYRARTSENLGSAKLEPVGEGPAALFDDPLALAGLGAAAAVAAGALPEREPHPGAFLGLRGARRRLRRAGDLAGRLRPLRGGPAGGARLRPRPVALRRHRVRRRPDLRQPQDRPRRRRAEAAAPYADRLLALPPFLLRRAGGLEGRRGRRGLTLTGHFLEQYVFGPLNRPLPPARVWLLDRLTRPGGFSVGAWPTAVRPGRRRPRRRSASRRSWRQRR